MKPYLNEMDYMRELVVSGEIPRDLFAVDFIAVFNGKTILSRIHREYVKAQLQANFESKNVCTRKVLIEKVK